MLFFQMAAYKLVSVFNKIRQEKLESFKEDGFNRIAFAAHSARGR